MRNNTNGNNVHEESIENDKFLGTWPHVFNPALACLGCTLGLLNIDRFAILSIQFGVNFIVQFLIMSVLLGIPLLTLQVCLGQRLKAGVLNMWKISPLFRGVGVALLVVQACIGIYSIVGVSWMLVYLRDSFIVKEGTYRWAEGFMLSKNDSNMLQNSTMNKLMESISSYFNQVVLQRQNITKPYITARTLKFQVAFNLGVVWMIIFISLSKGLKSYGKVIYFFTLIPILSNLVLCVKVLCLIPRGSLRKEKFDSAWNEFFTNGKSWTAASSEAFFTWGLLGAAAMQHRSLHQCCRYISCNHEIISINGSAMLSDGTKCPPFEMIAAHSKDKHLLRRNITIVIGLTIVVLLLNAFIAKTCVQILGDNGYIFTATSFEKISSYKFLHHPDHQATPSYNSTNDKFISRASFLLGQRTVQTDTDLVNESGYQVLKFSTELVPSTIALLGAERITPVWTILFYLVLIFFGLTQQLAIWYCVIMGVLSINTKRKKTWETKITFFSCIFAYILGLPMTTEVGIYVIYFLDFVIGGSWWIMILYIMQFGAVFAVRGRPHTGESIVAELFSSTDKFLKDWAGPILSFIWNIVLPITLLTLSIVVFKSGGFRELYLNHNFNKHYWTVCARQIGITIQLVPILIIPGVAIIQTCRYLNNGPPDILDRMQLLCRPSLEFARPQTSQDIGEDRTSSNRAREDFHSTTELIFEDSPPKYTPPPSYTTATGARVAKILRQSFRKSIRRIGSMLGESNILKSKPTIPQSPPEYKP